MKPLIVYKASAGSGKTFTLAVEYISLLVKNPESYRSILAVTFTNKATEEMKMRIISQLYGIARRLDESKGYLQEVVQRTGFDEEKVAQRAAIALSSLIHNYNYFRIQTIDAFFQSVLRNLARELRLTANLRIDLNDQQVAEQAVDEMIASLDSNHDVLLWINDYIKRNIEDNKGWNVIKEIKEFSKNVFRDFYKSHAKELDELSRDGRFFNQYIKDLRERRDRINSALTKEGRSILATLASHGYDNEEYYKYGEKGTILKYIRQLADQKWIEPLEIPARTQKFLDDPAKMISKNAPVSFTDFATERLVPMMERYHEIHRRNWSEYQSATLTLRHLSQLRLLKAIADMVAEIDKSTNRFQLSNTQHLLNELIDNSDSPFIFEKIGAQLRHIMIDEFQDTSTIQWANFKILLKNCLAQAHSHNLIVGDVKQSIYRWRSGDWRLLNNIDNEFSSDEMLSKPLSTNYRSEQKVVEFNNAFFSEAVKVTMDELERDKTNGAEQLVRAYDTEELVQKVKKSNGLGHVSITLLLSEDYDEKVMEHMMQTIDTLISNGAAFSDIAILARANSEIEYIAEVITREHPDWRIVSDEAFRLDTSVAVNTLIQALRVLDNPEERLLQAVLVKNYQHGILQNDYTISDLLLHPNFSELLPDGFTQQRQELLRMPFSELTDRLYSLFQLNRLPEESAFICTFLDYLTSYLQDYSASIKEVLSYWDDTLCRKTIQSESTDGIRIMSIHKSKGLEFAHVIIPYCDWQLEKSNTIWCERKEQDPFDKLPIVPIDFNKRQMAGTVYESDYREEHLQNVVDNMNMLYVAFTRAGKSLTVMGKRMSEDRKKKKINDITSNNRSEVIEECIKAVAQKLEGCSLSGMDGKEEIVFEWGDICESVLGSTAEKNKEKTADNISETSNEGKNPFSTHLNIPTTKSNPFTQTPEPYRVQMNTYPIPVEFRQSNKSRDFIKGEDELPSDRQRYIQMGSVLHEIFSNIHTLDDIETQLALLEHEGIIYHNDITSDELRQHLRDAFQDNEAASWFAPYWRVLNECTILEPKTVTDPMTGQQTIITVEHRPDRVITDGNQFIVIDFKFGMPRPEHYEQVCRYIDKLHAMGCHNVSGRLWYVLKQRVDKIEYGNQDNVKV